MRLKVLRVSKSTDDSISLWFQRDSLNYLPGQHGVFSFNVDGKKLNRTYSFHTAPQFDKDIAITIRQVEGGVVSNFLTKARTAEIQVELNKIEGGFTLQPSSQLKRHLIMFAGGSGITPIFSMIRSLLHEEPRSTVSLIYSNKSHKRIIFNHELQAIELEFQSRLRVFHIITQDEEMPADVPVFYKGRLSKMIIKKIVKSILAEIDCDVEYYLCGPYQFMHSVEETIQSMNPDNSKIYKEHFFIPDQTPAFDHTGLPDREILLSIRDEHKVVSVRSGKSILQASLEAGIKLPFSCTEGQCGTCRAMLISGEVKLKKNHVLTDEELNAGQILLCQGFPVSEGVTIKTSL